MNKKVTCPNCRNNVDFLLWAGSMINVCSTCYPSIRAEQREKEMQAPLWEDTPMMVDCYYCHKTVPRPQARDKSSMGLGFMCEDCHFEILRMACEAKKNK